MHRASYWRFVVAACLLASAGCSILPDLQPTSTSSPPPTSAPPTSTSVPFAAKIDGEIIPLELFESEVKRFELAQTSAGIDLATQGDYKSLVLDELIDLRLLAQGARAQGLSVEETEIERRLEEIETELGGTETMDAWLSEYFYSYESFREALKIELMAMNMVNWIAENVPTVMDQVHARHILVATREEANALLSQLAAGADFDNLARQLSLDASTRLAGGDLGWFPQGALLQAAVEEAAFSTQPGELSSVVESELGFHVIEVIERGEQPLSFQDRLAFQERAVQDWLEIARTSAVIERNITH